MATDISPPSENRVSAFLHFQTFARLNLRRHPTPYASGNSNCLAIPGQVGDELNQRFLDSK